VIRDYGVEGIRRKIRDHLAWAAELAEEIRSTGDFELFEPQNLGLVCFRYSPPGEANRDKLNEVNDKLMRRLNATGKIYLTHTRVNGLITLRMVVGQTNVTRAHVQNAWKLIRETAKNL
jgi:aromatic-L-amino-acid decarboxylase